MSRAETDHVTVPRNDLSGGQITALRKLGIGADGRSMARRARDRRRWAFVAIVGLAMVTVLVASERGRPRWSSEFRAGFDAATKANYARESDCDHLSGERRRGCLEWVNLPYDEQAAD